LHGRFLDRIADGTISLGPATTYRLEDIPKAHADIDANRVTGKLVGITSAAGAKLTASPEFDAL
jgi:NADPH2:quinone reductase